MKRIAQNLETQKNHYFFKRDNLCTMNYLIYAEEIFKCTWSAKNKQFLKLIDLWKKGSIAPNWSYKQRPPWKKQLKIFEEYIQNNQYDDGFVPIDETFNNVVYNKKNTLRSINVIACIAYISLHGGLRKPENCVLNEEFRFKVEEIKFEQYLKNKSCLEETSKPNYSLYLKEDKDIFLDKNIIFRAKKDDECLLLKKLTNGYKHKIKIQPIHANIIMFLYSQRDSGKTFTLQEISKNQDIPKHSLETRQGEIFKIYEKNNINPLKDILHKENSYYQLNPMLDCKNTH